MAFPVYAQSEHSVSFPAVWSDTEGCSNCTEAPTLSGKVLTLEKAIYVLNRLQGCIYREYLLGSRRLYSRQRQLARLHLFGVSAGR